jgi:hypothetical protein
MVKKCYIFRYFDGDPDQLVWVDPNQLLVKHVAPKQSKLARDKKGQEYKKKTSP